MTIIHLVWNITRGEACWIKWSSHSYHLSFLGAWLCVTQVFSIQPQHSRRLLKNSNNRKRQHWTEWKFMECHYIDIFITENTIPRMTNDWFVFNQANRHATTQKPQCTCWKTWLAICLINCNQSTCFQRFVLIFFLFVHVLTSELDCRICFISLPFQYTIANFRCICETLQW